MICLLFYFQKYPFDDNFDEARLKELDRTSSKIKSRSIKRKKRYQVLPIKSEVQKHSGWNDPRFDNSIPENISRLNRNLVRKEEDSESCSCTSCRCELCLNEQNLVSLSDPYLFFTPKVEAQSSSDSPRGNLFHIYISYHQI